MSTMAAARSAVPLTVYNQHLHKDVFEDFIDINAMDSTPSAPTSSMIHQSRSSSITSPASTVTFDNGDDLQTPAKPSHEYDQYKQQTGLPSGSMTGLVGPSHTSYSSSFGFDNIGAVGDADLNGFGSMTADPSMEFDTTPSDLHSYLSPNASQNIFDDFVNPSEILAAEKQPEQTIRFFPGMHSQQAAKAQAQRKQAQQQAMLQQQRQQQQQQQQAAQRQREQTQSRSHQSRKSASHITDARTEETIARVVNQIRQNSANNDDDEDSNSGLLPHIIRAKKDEEEMDEDERLLASEEGKKLSSKERRQLRNKVSARAFRSRRKEYIGQLEGEVNAKNNECVELRTQNRALMEENARSRAFIEKLLRHPAFNPFLEDLSQDSALTESSSQSSQSSTRQSVPVTPAQPQVVMHSRSQEMHNITEEEQKPQVNMGQMQEQPDMSMLNLNSNESWGNMGGMDFNFNAPQIFAVLELPEHPIDTETLSGKSNLEFFSNDDEDKVDYPTLNSSPVQPCPAAEEIGTSNESDLSDIENDPSFALYVSTPAGPSKTAEKELEPSDSILGDVNIEKGCSSIHLVIAGVRGETESTAAVHRLDTLCSRADTIFERLLALTSEPEL